MLEHIVDNIYQVSPGKNTIFPYSFCFYIDDEIKTLIDTPIFPDFVKHLEGRKVDRIINTHFHRDHCGSNYIFPEAEIFAHAEDIPPMQSIESFSLYYGFEKYGGSEIAAALLPKINWQPSHINGELKEGEIISSGKINLKVIHTPGHTPGHCVLFWEEKGLLFAGDIDLTSFGPWYGNDVSDIDLTIKSIEKIIDLKPEIILSGHRGTIKENTEKELKKYLDKIYLKEERILKALDTPKTLEELIELKIVYGRFKKPENLYAFFEKVSLLNHLKRLIKLNLVTYHEGKYHKA
ncbi:MBL fold metallo-hydrolase [Thermosyntropha sp.]|uniref:MBL fold metallo-hydrolase n=1 Tax=Thermosyntropha sp. TaxID=2740820 RepID=UPI0025D3AC6F|nr:MBL fold metallo-hydrolase [Thermosyntropha sp.]MBO8158764.1 MBL fold metallo-hydrolase [Thermosyntropha sp.]